MTCWIITRAIILIVLSTALIVVNEAFWRPQYPSLATWILVDAIFFLLLGISKVLERIYKSMTCWDNVFMFWLRRIQAYISVSFKVFIPFYFFFLIGWTVYGIYILSEKLWYIDFTFHFTALLLVIIQIIVILLIMTLGLVAGWFFITCKERSAYDAYVVAEEEIYRESLAKIEIEEEKLLLKRNDNYSTSKRDLQSDKMSRFSHRQVPEPKKRSCDDLWRNQVMAGMLSPIIQFLIEWVLKQLIIDELFEEFIFKQIKTFVQENDPEYKGNTEQNSRKDSEHEKKPETPEVQVNQEKKENENNETKADNEINETKVEN